MTNIKGKLLIFIVAYHAERTIEQVVSRIPLALAQDYDVEVLIIDDSSGDETFLRGELMRRGQKIPFKMTVLFNPVNQGYGGNQKIGYHYAVENGFDWVALVHGDGQYAPECLPQLVDVLANGQAEAVFGSRMLAKGGALKGGMPLYKYIGNKILTTYQNTLLGTNLSEFHSGYRLYAVKALAAVPFELNSNDFHFDTEIIIQFVNAEFRIKELPIPTFYGDEVCRVNGMAYAWNVSMTTLQARLQRYYIFYDRKFDCSARKRREKSRYDIRFVDQQLANQVRNGSTVLIIGAAREPLLRDMEKKECRIISYKDEDCLVESQILAGADYIVLTDTKFLGHYPEQLLAKLRNFSIEAPDITLLLPVGNVAFAWIRLMLLCGRFGYARRGILNTWHQRLFTKHSLQQLFLQNGFTVLQLTGVPVPYELICSSAKTASVFRAVHLVLIALWKNLFSYQFVVMAKPQPTLQHLLKRAKQAAAEKQAAHDSSFNSNSTRS
ncbi:glycosyltransferase family 2 protein [Candidatus Electronema sp. JM]|uniref:glycosyltransferase family 2 protein n=1 Tax=Candidatus Electronema sp. JM TaxID=3401571 RepID=UPI003AA91934